MDISNTFLPVAIELIQNVFPTPVSYIRNLGSSYDPATGEVTQNTEQFNISAGVISRARVEEGGVGETYSLTLWIDHSPTGMPHLPTTSDSVTYDGTTWKVVSIDPTYSSTGLIASKIVARAD
jgi:hypothetical protein